MSTNKILPFPAIDVILDAPPVLKASENSFFPEQVAKRFRLVPNLTSTLLFSRLLPARSPASL